MTSERSRYLVSEPNWWEHPYLSYCRKPLLKYRKTAIQSIWLNTLSLEKKWTKRIHSMPGKDKNTKQILWKSHLDLGGSNHCPPLLLWFHRAKLGEWVKAQKSWTHSNMGGLGSNKEHLEGSRQQECTRHQQNFSVSHMFSPSLLISLCAFRKEEKWYQIREELL